MKTISDKIFELLKEKGMSQKEFAQRTGIAESSISDWKKKRTNPVSDKILIICEVLDVTPYELLSGAEHAGNRSRDNNTYVISKETEWILRCGRAASPVWREPPVRTNGATSFCLLSLLCHYWIQSIYFSHREVFRWVNTFNIDLIGIIRYTIHDGIGKSTFTITDLLVPFTFTELRTKDC